MVRHIVLFQIDKKLSTSEKHELFVKFKSAIERLPETITFISHIEVGNNINSDEIWDICLLSEFNSLEDIRRYSVHPDHIRAAGIIKPYLTGRSCVDYTIPN